MEGDLSFERVSYDSRIDAMAGDIEDFVDTVLKTIDANTAKRQPEMWKIVCRYFAGCARAARAQCNNSTGGSTLIVRYLKSRFPYDGDGSNEGFFEFMDWLSKSEKFKPSALRDSLEKR